MAPTTNCLPCTLCRLLCCLMARGWAGSMSARGLAASCGARGKATRCGTRGKATLSCNPSCLSLQPFHPRFLLQPALCTPWEAGHHPCTALRHRWVPSFPFNPDHCPHLCPYPAALLLTAPHASARASDGCVLEHCIGQMPSLAPSLATASLMLCPFLYLGNASKCLLVPLACYGQYETSSVACFAGPAMLVLLYLLMLCLLSMLGMMCMLC